MKHARAPPIRDPRHSSHGFSKLPQLAMYTNSPIESISYLVGGLEHGFYDFPFHKWDVILPIDELIFFKMVKTTNQ